MESEREKNINSHREIDTLMSKLSYNEAEITTYKDQISRLEASTHALESQVENMKS